MSFEDLCTKYELFFYHEFIDDPNFPSAKKELLQRDLGCYYIPNDFTIYQTRADAESAITKEDYHNNYGTVMIMLSNMPLFKAVDFIEFHYKMYDGEKIKFLKNVYHEFKGAKFSQGKNEIPAPMPFQIVMNWCKEKLDEIETTYSPKKRSEKTFVNLSRIEEIRKINSIDFDLKKLVKFLEEINDNYAAENFLSVAMLGRAVLDHVPPIFNFRNFNEVANNYGGASFKKNMSHLNISMRSIADNFLHGPITRKEALPNENQIDFSRELDFLLAEIVKKF